MATIDIYKQYFSAECTFNDVERRGASVWLTADSCSGTIRYEVGVSFFPHRDEEDFAVSYDACGLKELLNTQGRRSKKRDEEIANARQVAMYCMRDITSMTMEEIGAEFGGRNHSSVTHSIKKVTQQLQNDQNLKDMVDDIIKNSKG